jgi:DNA-directed RNA polymerase subunit RPC12/RpoP
MLEKYDFHCPYCKYKLNGDNKLIKLDTIRQNGDKGTIYFSASIGDFSYEHEPKVDFEPGELVNFCCSSCNKDLSSDQFDNYARLILDVNGTVQFDILFSRKAGVKKTYLITEEGVETYSGT